MTDEAIDRLVDDKSEPGAWARHLKHTECMRSITLPFPPASFSGHNTGNRFKKAPQIKEYRDLAALLTRQAKLVIPSTGDIRIHFKFVPPDNRGDRVNFPNRMKPQIDGIADGLGVNDKRFLPSYEFAEPRKPGWVVVTI